MKLFHLGLYVSKLLTMYMGLLWFCVLMLIDCKKKLPLCGLSKAPVYVSSSVPLGVILLLCSVME